MKYLCTVKNIFQFFSSIEVKIQTFSGNHQFKKNIRELMPTNLNVKKEKRKINISNRIENFLKIQNSIIK